MREENHMIMSGRILAPAEYSHKGWGEDFAAMKVAVSRLSGVEDHLPVILPQIFHQFGEYRKSDHL